MTTAVATARAEAERLAALEWAGGPGASEARAARPAAIAAVWAAEGAQLRAEAAAKRAEAEAITARVAELLAELEALQGIGYGESPRPGGVWSRCQQLGADAAELDRQAARRERQRPLMSGTIMASTAAELGPILRADPLRFAPALPEVAAWAERQEAALRQQLERQEAALRQQLERQEAALRQQLARGHVDQTAPLVFQLMWNEHAKIEPIASSVSLLRAKPWAQQRLTVHRGTRPGTSAARGASSGEGHPPRHLPEPSSAAILSVR